jgi:hypothetical protein
MWLHLGKVTFGFGMRTATRAAGPASGRAGRPLPPMSALWRRKKGPRPGSPRRGPHHSAPGPADRPQRPEAGSHDPHQRAGHAAAAEGRGTRRPTAEAARRGRETEASERARTERSSDKTRHDTPPTNEKRHRPTPPPAEADRAPARKAECFARLGRAKPTSHGGRAGASVPA